MSQTDLLDLAKKGDIDAISTIINRNLNPKGIKAKFSKNGNCLRVLLETQTPPIQSNLVDYIQKSVDKLEISQIETLQIFGRKIGDKIPTWSQKIDLKTPLLSLSNENNNPAPHTISDTPTDLRLLRAAAKKGDLQALSSLVSQAIPYQNIKVEASMQHNIMICLNIHSPTKTEPQSCTKAVINLLNNIQLEKVGPVQISEIPADKKAQGWCKHLAFRNGKFVDNTTFVNIQAGIIFALIISLVGYCASTIPKQFAAISTSEQQQTQSSEQQQTQSSEQQQTQSSEQQQTQSSEQQQTQSSEQQLSDVWYIGGTLHNASALEWNKASYENKLATCGSIIYDLWKDGELNPSLHNQIETTSDMKIVAAYFVGKMDIAAQKYDNLQVSAIMAVIILSEDWIKTSE